MTTQEKVLLAKWMSAVTGFIALLPLSSVDQKRELLDTVREFKQATGICFDYEEPEPE